MWANINFKCNYMTNKDHLCTFYTISKLNEKNKIKYFSDLPTLIFLSTLPETDIYFILALVVKKNRRGGGGVIIYLFFISLSNSKLYMYILLK